MSGTSHLVTMVCDIAKFFASESDRAVAVDGIVNHIEKFWNPRMQRKLIESFSAEQGDVSPLVRAAIEQLAKASPPAS